jgi:hypothetical protein
VDEFPTLDDAYRKFGEASEAAQLIETELGTMLLLEEAIGEGLIGEDGKRATEILKGISRQTLGRLISNVKGKSSTTTELEVLLERALKERNRLSHSFFLKHNLRRNSGEGRVLMMKDLEQIHTVFLEACKALLELGGIDLEALAEEGLPTGHLPI